MNPHHIKTARDADLRLSVAALQRAAQRARQVARQTGTAIVISHDGVVEAISPASPPAAAAMPFVHEPPATSGGKP